MNARTSFLARLIGLYCIVVSVALLVRPEPLMASIAALAHDPPALLVIEVVGLVAGLAMVLGHNVWSGGALPVVVTLIGWWALIKSALGLFLPATAMTALFEASRNRGLYRLSSIVTLIIGAYLIYGSLPRRRPRR